MKILAIIPARGGSKGIKKKNIRKFAGKPLMALTIAAAQNSKLINRVVVSTDSEEIAAVARKYKAEVPILRPVELAADSSKVSDAVAHMLSFLKEKDGYEPDVLVLLQTTSPLREAQDIDGALTLLFKNGSGADAVVSVCGTEQLLYTRDAGGLLRLVSSPEFLKSVNRQELPPTYKLDGSMVYAIKVPVFLKEKSFLPPRTLGYVIPRWRAVDLDEAQDFVVGEIVFKNKISIKNKINKFSAEGGSVSGGK